MLWEPPTRPGAELLSNFIFRDFKGISEMLVTQTLLLLEIFHSSSLLCAPSPPPTPQFGLLSVQKNHIPQMLLKVVSLLLSNTWLGFIPLNIFKIQTEA